MAMLALALLCALPAQAAGGPDLGEGVLADVGYGLSGIEWRVFAEHRSVILTVSTPCGVIQRTYDSGKSPFFALKELEPDDPNGTYTWQIRINPVVDPKIQAMLADARGSGEEQALYRELWREGLLPKGPFVQTGSFSVEEGVIIEPVGAEKEGSQARFDEGDGLRASGAGAGAVSGELESVFADAQIISPDGVVYNSLCVGFDCPTSPTFGADTIRLQENNLRIHVEDTSTASSFPTTDWRLEFNSQANGGGGYFRVIDVSANRNLMTLEASAPSNSLYVDSSGDVGTGTANPVLDFHAASGDTPGLRLEQTTASGFAAQIWDIAGNETSFFVRDVTSGSRLPFRIRPGASSNSLVIDSDSQVGVGTLSPTEALHVRKSDGSAKAFVEETSTTALQRTLLQLTNNGGTEFRMTDTSSSVTWLFQNTGGNFRFTDAGDAFNEFILNQSGDLTITGDLTANGTNYPSSRTLKEGFTDVDSRDILQRLAAVPVTLWQYKSDADAIRHIGPVTEDFSAAFDFLEADGKLNTIDLHGVTMAAIQGLNELVGEKDARIEELEQRLAALEALLAQPAGE